MVGAEVGSDGLAKEARNADSGRGQDLDGRRAGRLAGRKGPRVDARAALRQRHLRGHPCLRDEAGSGGLPPGRPHPPALPLGAPVPHGDPVLGRGAAPGGEGHDPGQRTVVVLHPAAGDPRLRRDGPQPAGRAHQRVDRRVAVGRLPGRGRARVRRPGQDLLLEAQRPQHAAAGREGDRPVRELGAREGGVAEGRLRRGHHAEHAGPRLRRHRRERVHGPGRRRVHAAARRRAASRASPATRS